MTYELARELKNAGFPQNYKLGSPYYFKDQYTGGEWRLNNTPTYESWDEETTEIQECLYIPSLSELIAACGDIYICLEHMDTYWMVSMYTTDDARFEDLKSFTGDTPEEAMAQLFLELNKKCKN